MKIPTEELPTIVKKNCEEQAKSIQKIVHRYNYGRGKFPSKISAWQYMAHQEIAYPGFSILGHSQPVERCQTAWQEAWGNFEAKQELF